MMTLFRGGGGKRDFMDKTILWTSGRFWKGADLRGSPGNLWGGTGNFRESLGSFRGTSRLLLSSTARELPGKSPGNFWGSSGNFWGSLGIRGRKHMNRNIFAGLSRDWVGGKTLFVCFWGHSLWGRKNHINKIPPKIPILSVYVLCLFVFSAPNFEGNFPEARGSLTPSQRLAKFVCKELGNTWHYRIGKHGNTQNEAQIRQKYSKLWVLVFLVYVFSLFCLWGCFPIL